jgi:large subunit ribosomal protein L15
MQVHQLQPVRHVRARKRVGRGGKRGTYSGRGNKGQGARAGRKMVPIIRELIKRYPKLRGYRRNYIKNPVSNVTLAVLNARFSDNETVSPATLLEKRVIRKFARVKLRVKILASGALTKKLNFENVFLSKGAKTAIEKVGGTVR